MLFDMIPDKFFSPLSAPGKVVYWDCLSRMFAITSRQLSYGVERDVLVDELQYYFESNMAADIEEEDMAGHTSSRDKANFVLRKLEVYGWISIDTDHSYVQRVNFCDYAIVMMKTLLSIQEARDTEYQAYIYTIYSLARNLREQPGIGLLQIVENTDMLLTGLKSLNANIKKYIDDLTKHSTVQEILDALLNDYYSNVVDKAYHRLMTSDNVSKFRPEIIERLESCAYSESFVQAAMKEIAELREIPEPECREEVLTMLHDLVNAFRSIDDIIDDINKKNTRYQKAAINRAKFLLTSGEDLRGQLKNILSYMNEKITEQRLDLNGVVELEEMDRLIRIFSWEYLDTDSLYAPIQGHKEFVPEDREIKEANMELREEKRALMMARLQRVLSPERIQGYVLESLGERQHMRASELPLDSKDTFIRLIYIRLYGQRKNVGYQLELLDTVEKDGFTFRDFMIKRRQG